jgi:hypothetical protein
VRQSAESQLRSLSSQRHRLAFNSRSKSRTHRLNGDNTGEPEQCEWANLVGYEKAITTTIQEAEGDPKTMQEVQACDNWPSWKEVMDRRISSLEQARTWTTVPRPTGKNVVGCKCVFILKRKVDRSIDKYKACLVTRGFTQIYSINYYDTYSPVAHLASFHLILAIAAQNNWEVEAFDFNSAYLNGELNTDEEIYMQELLGYKTVTEDGVKKLLKALYGLKQAGHKWYDALDGALTDLGFHVARADPRVFITRIGDSILLLVVHIDDCTMTGSSAELIAIYKAKLHKWYALMDLGPVNWLLGIQITCNQEVQTISLSQKAYIKSILARFELSNAKPYSTPMVPSTSYSKSDSPVSANDATHMWRVPYCEAIRSLMYTSVATQPDITFAVSMLSQFLKNLGEAHWEVVKRVFRYLASMHRTALTYRGERHDLEGFTDADGASQDHR